MKRIVIVLLVGLLSFHSSFAQTQVTIEGVKQILPKKGQSYYFQRIPLKNNAVPQIRLINLQTKELSQGIPKEIKTTNSFIPDVFIGVERKQKYATLQIPVFKNENNHIEQLTGYDISLTYPKDYKSDPRLGQKPTGASHSVLSSGNWYKISVPQRGIYKIDYAFLQSMGINPAQINPNNIRIYGNGGTVLPETVSDNQPDDLKQNAVYVHASGNTFTQGDYVLFYANGPTLWSKDSADSRFSHTSNYYEDKSYYFLNFDLGAGERVASVSANGTGNQTYTDFNDYALYHRGDTNIAAVSRSWWSNPMVSETSMPSSSSLSMNLGGLEDSIFAKVHVANVNEANGNTLTMKVNGQTAHTFTLSSSGGSSYYIDQTATFKFKPTSPNLAVNLNYNPMGNGSAFLGYIELNYKRPLSFSGNEMTFRNWSSAALPSSQLAAYNISNAPVDLKVWDITNPLQPIALNGTPSGNQYHLTRPGGQLHEFIAFSGQQFPNPNYIETVANQDLHSLPETDLLIITNQDLKPIAEEFANFHRQRDHIRVTVATVDKIYNEFSSGGQDIGGIRNFIKMFYDRAQNNQGMIKNVLLLGAASYDYKDRISRNTNIVPTYETVIGSNENYAFSTDDYFAILDSGENVLSSNNLLDVGIGRIPARTVQEAQEALAKIKNYVSPSSFGPWKNIVSFVADDHDPGASGMNHLNDCETISDYFYSDNRLYNLYKIYADAFKMVAEAGGSRYPDVNKAINDRIFNGTFLMSYSGHGNATRWAHEAILTPDDYDSWKNINHLPIIFTGTCDFGRFDDPAVRYAGVKLMMNPDGGCIAIVTTTQAVYQSGNTQLASSYMQQQFTKQLNHQFYTLGEALRKAKNDIGNGAFYNKVKFVLLGDPALQLPIPQLNVKTDSLLMKENGQYIPKDTVKALGDYSLKGSITDDQNVVQSDFNGTVYVTIFDKPTTIRTVNNAPGVTPTLKIQNSVVAKARAVVQNGHFTANFIAPKDINYDMGKGKISYYANSNEEDANGIDTTVNVGGFNENATADDEPPIVKAYIDNDQFRDGGVTGPNPMLYVTLFDDHGINVSGSSIGHDLVAILDGDIENPIVLNDYYQTEEGDFRKGYIYFPMHNLPEGQHTIRIKAWDSYDNSGEGSVTFVVKNKDKGFISEFYNYPNPVTDITHFVFQHNQAGEPMKITLQVFNTNGSLKWAQSKQITPEGNRTMVTWGGNDLTGHPLAKGDYFCRLHIQTEKGVQATAYLKLVLLRP